MESKITSKPQNKYAQVFVVPPVWVEAYPMRRKSEAHKALSLLLHKYGASIKMIMDDSKEQMFNEFDRKLKDADVISHPIEPYSPAMARFGGTYDSGTEKVVEKIDGNEGVSEETLG
jgi:hypothetical protein